MQYLRHSNFLKIIQAVWRIFIRRQAIIWNNDDSLSTEHTGTHFTKFESKYSNVRPRRRVWKRLLKNDGHFISALMRSG